MMSILLLHKAQVICPVCYSFLAEDTVMHFKFVTTPLLLGVFFPQPDCILVFIFSAFSVSNFQYILQVILNP
jgi:hypothetical protein